MTLANQQAKLPTDLSFADMEDRLAILYHIQGASGIDARFLKQLKTFIKYLKITTAQLNFQELFIDIWTSHFADFALLMSSMGMLLKTSMMVVIRDCFFVRGSVYISPRYVTL